LEHSGATKWVHSLSPRASTPAPQTLARVGEGWGEGPLVDRMRRPLTPPRETRGDPLPQGERVTEHAACASSVSTSPKHALGSRCGVLQVRGTQAPPDSSEQCARHRGGRPETQPFSWARS
jgi:hypothetical protein